jgi:hypothetical protein
MRLFLIGFAALLVSCIQAPPYHDHGPHQGHQQGPVAYPPAQPPIYTPIPQPLPQPPVTQPGQEICGGMMGGSCSVQGEFCYRTVEAQCGAADQTGVCRPVPQICTQEYAPVCGCNGQTYTNECNANGSGVSAAYRGPCRN